jgi:predicted nucleic acid-binding protein
MKKSNSIKINKVLLDTCFLIELSDKNKPLHQNAKEYFDYFNENNIPYYLSPIVVSEYWQNDLVKDFPIKNFKLLSFNFPEGLKAAEINRVLKKIKETNNNIQLYFDKGIYPTERIINLNK